MLSVITALIGTIVGFILKTGYDYSIYSKERYDKYFFAILSKRFEVYQEANVVCEEMKKIVHDITDEKYKVTHKAREWYHSNNLYFSPELRKSFQKVIFDVEFYGDTHEDFYFTLNQKGKDDPKTQEKRRELYSKWNSIMGGIQEKLQQDIDNYFKVLEI